MQEPSAKRFKTETCVISKIPDENDHKNDMFSILPNEVLVQIFSYLSPSDLLCINDLGNSRYSKLTFIVRHADFSLSSRIQKDRFASFFCLERIQYIRKLTLNFLTFVPVTFLMKCILKCKHLAYLSIISCGLTCEYFLTVFTSCKALEEVVYAVKCSCNALSKVLNNFDDYIANFSLKKFYYDGNLECSIIKKIFAIESIFKYPLRPEKIKTSIYSDCIFETYNNVTVLDISGYCEAQFALPVFHPLKLKKLIVSSCIFKQSDLPLDDKRRHNELSFEKLITNCVLVENFSLIGCTLCSFGPKDEDLIPLQKWKNLKYLKISMVKTLRTCRFLKHVSDSCANLELLSLHEIGERSVCHYALFVCYLLKNSKKLTYLRIHQASFYPLCGRFWSMLSCAQNLQYISLDLKELGYFSHKPILTALEKLPYIQMFYINCFGTTGFLRRIRKIIMSHKVVNNDVLLGATVKSERNAAHYLFDIH